jgi:hypothetical protein
MYHFWVMMCVAASLFIAQLSRDLLVELYFLFTSKTLIEERTDGD